MSDDVKKALEELEQTFAIVHRVATHQSDAAYMSIPADPKRDADLRHMVAVESLRAHIDAEPARLAAALEEQREADALALLALADPECSCAQEEDVCAACEVDGYARVVRATPLTATPLGDELAQVRRERDALKVRALGAEARVMELEEEQEARDDVMTAEQRLKFWEENPHACPVHFGARTACGQCHDSTAQQLTNLRIEHEAVVNEVETAEARVKELLALGEQRCDGIGCDWGEECVRLVAERDALKARVRKLEAELDEGVRVLMGVLSSPGFVDLAQSDRDALKTFLAKASTALKEGAR